MRQTIHIPRATPACTIEGPLQHVNSEPPQLTLLLCSSLPVCSARCQDELKKSLYLVFSQFGNIVEINANNTYKMRGQAWIVFDQLNSGTNTHTEERGRTAVPALRLNALAHRGSARCSCTQPHALNAR